MCVTILFELCQMSSAPEIDMTDVCDYSVTHI